MIKIGEWIPYLKKQQIPILFFSIAPLVYPFSKFIFRHVHKYLFPSEKSKTDIEQYIDTQKDKLNTFIDNSLSVKDRNHNISSEFYNKKQLNSVLQDVNNEIEQSWKRRMLFENTPRGNIIMYYDPYKLGFAYYSDNTSIPYHLLNAIAMKYVRMFRCLDFFFDNQDLKQISILQKIHSEEEKKEQSEEEKKESDDFKAKLRDAPFLKRKKSETKKDDKLEMKKKQEADNKEKDKDESPKFHNCFVHMGKIYNLPFLNIPRNLQQTKVSFSSPLLNNLAQETDLQKKVLNWKDYKNKLGGY